MTLGAGWQQGAEKGRKGNVESWIFFKIYIYITQARFKVPKRGHVPDK